MYRLIFLNGRLKGRRVAVQQGTLLIGRDSSCQIDLADDERVSREHARIEQRGGAIWIKDLGALNKTVVNDKPVDEARLNHGDRIEIGGTMLEFQVIDASPVGARRRMGKVQAITYVAIGLVLLMEAVFVFLFPLWQSQNIPPAEKSVKVAAVTGTPLTVAQELEQARARLAAATQEVAATTSASPAAVAAEVEELRAAVAGLREQLQGMVAGPVTGGGDVATAVATSSAPVAVTSTPSDVAATVAPTSAPVVAEAASVADAVPSPLIDEARPEDEPLLVEERPEEDPLTERAKELLALALEEVARANYIAADQLLERLQVMAPDFVPGYVERARLSEKRGQLAKAGEQWQQVMKRTAGTPLYNEAAAERQRLARTEAMAAVARQAAPERTTANRLPRRVRIVSIDRERFQGNKEFDEMRLVRVNLKPRLSEGALDEGDLAVWVTFYDRVAGKNEVVPTGATVPLEPLRVEGPWAAGEAKSVTATYIVSKGFRQDEADTTGARRTYEGYRVQVFYKDELQDEDAQPRALLDLTPPALPQVSVRDRLDRPIPLR